MVRKITFFGLAILVSIYSGFTVSRSFAQAGPPDFEEIDTYISAKMKELGIPGAALVIVQGDQIVKLKAYGVADTDGHSVTPHSTSPLDIRLGRIWCHSGLRLH